MYCLSPPDMVKYGGNTLEGKTCETRMLEDDSPIDAMLEVAYRGFRRPRLGAFN